MNNENTLHGAKLWEKSVHVTEEIDRFTVGHDRELDLYLAKYDVLGSMAHVTMLHSIGLIADEELPVLLRELRAIYQVAESGDFVIEDGIEDVHSQVELMLTRKLGDMGKKIHSGRSRNDQVLVDLKLFTRDKIREVAEAVRDLFAELQQQSERYKNVLMPGYTHLQVAMPSSFGLWFGAYAESLADDMLLLEAAYRMTNRNPLGSAAGYGSSFPLNRTMTTELLGFDSMDYNVVYAQMGRGKTSATWPSPSPVSPARWPNWLSTLACSTVRISVLCACQMSVPRGRALCPTRKTPMSLNLSVPVATSSRLCQRRL